MDALVRRAIVIGLVGGGAVIHISLVGMVHGFQARDTIADLLSVGSLLPILIAIIVGSQAGGPMRHPHFVPTPARGISMGAVAGAVTGLVTAALMLFIELVDLRWILPNANAATVGELSYGQGAYVGSALVIVVNALLGAAGAALRVLPAKVSRAIVTAGVVTILLALMEPFVTTVLGNVGLEVLEDLLYEGGGLTLVGFLVLFAVIAASVYAWGMRGSATRERVAALPPNRRQAAKIAVYLATIGLLLLLPQIIGSRLSEVVGTVGLYVLLGLGLNIVVGFAGLLDLGYVAFYAVGAYTTAVLTSAASPLFAPELPFFAALPFVIVAAAMIGLMVGTPVLRLRGDYLAIVTLGFGEIVRILFLSSWLQPVTGGSQGILSVPPPLPFDRDPQSIYYPILLFCILAAIGATSLRSSRVGRAWNAMREDESVAEATGVNTVTYKLLAFMLGAAFGCLSGALFAAKIGSVFPVSFDLLVSINALALIILGGMGNIAGVVVGAFVLVGLPELLREFSEFRLLIYGAVLVAMMLLRPEGLIPSRSRRAELHGREDEEDQYAEGSSDEMPRPAVTSS